MESLQCKQGEVLFKQEQFDQAVTCFKDVLNNVPKEHPLCHKAQCKFFDLGNIFLKNEKYEQAVTYYNNALSNLSEENPKERLKMRHSKYKQVNIKNVFKFLLENVQEEPFDQYAYKHILVPLIQYNKGIALLKQKKHEQAKECFTKIPPAHSIYYKAQYELGGIFLHQERYKEAKNCFNNLPKEHPLYKKSEELYYITKHNQEENYYKIEACSILLEKLNVESVPVLGSIADLE